MGIFELSEAEKTLNYVFKDKNLLRTCFTHSSYSNENKSCSSNERLEFLGDSVLGLIVSEYLFLRDKEYREGVLTSEKQKYVSSVPLAETTKKLGLNRFLLLGAGNKLDKDNKNLCENLYEAVVGGLYLDGGMEVAKKFVYATLLSDTKKEKKIFDYKSELQTYTQRKKMGLPRYETLSETGKSNNPLFHVAVLVENKIVSEAFGNKKLVAEQACAKKALEIFLSDEKAKNNVKRGNPDGRKNIKRSQ